MKKISRRSFLTVVGAAAATAALTACGGSSSSTAASTSSAASTAAPAATASNASVVLKFDLTGFSGASLGPCSYRVQEPHRGEVRRQHDR